MSRLLNALRSFLSTCSRQSISPVIKSDIMWWLEFLPIFNGVSIIKPNIWDFADLAFTTDASLHGAGATCLDECFTVEFPEDIMRAAKHITGLELYTVVLAVNFWAPKLRGRKFIVSCDKEAAVTVINSGSTRDGFMQRCSRQLWFKASVFYFELTACHIPGVYVTGQIYFQVKFISTWVIFFKLGRKYTFKDLPKDCFQFQVD